MNNIRNKVIMDHHHLLMYRDFLLNNKVVTSAVAGASMRGTVVQKNKANFCSICGDDCICMNSNFRNYKFLNNNNLLLISKYCNENVFKNCIYFQK
jgi:hypothetical protein